MPDRSAPHVPPTLAWSATWLNAELVFPSLRFPEREPSIAAPNLSRFVAEINPAYDNGWCQNCERADYREPYRSGVGVSCIPAPQLQLKVGSFCQRESLPIQKFLILAIVAFAAALIFGTLARVGCLPLSTIS
jgi:hypothetical protein